MLVPGYIVTLCFLLILSLARLTSSVYQNYRGYYSNTDSGYHGNTDSVGLEEGEESGDSELEAKDFLDNSLLPVVVTSQDRYDNGHGTLIKLFYHLIGQLERNLADLKTSFTNCCLTCPSGYTMLGPTPRCYRLSEDVLPWQRARSVCQAEGGDLVSLQTPYEDYLVTDFVAKYKGLGGAAFRFYTSGNDQETKGTWVWGLGATAEQFSATRWAPGEPNQNDQEREDCAEVIQGLGWNDVPCYLPFRYVCETETVLKV